MVDLKTLELPLTLVPELQPPLVAIQLARDDRDVVAETVLACCLGQHLQLVLQAAQNILTETDHLAINGDPMPNIAREEGVGVLTLEETVMFS